MSDTLDIIIERFNKFGKKVYEKSDVYLKK